MQVKSLILEGNNLLEVTTQITLSIGVVEEIGVVEGLMDITNNVDSHTHHERFLHGDLLGILGRSVVLLL